jgi:hypothetical protein
MLVLDPPTLLAVAAVISSISNLIWAMRRRTSASDQLISSVALPDRRLLSRHDSRGAP